MAPRLVPALLLCPALLLGAGNFRPPAGNQPAIRRPGGSSVLPGGNIVKPLGRQFGTGVLPLAIAINSDQTRVATANNASVTVTEKVRGQWRVRQLDRKEWLTPFVDAAFTDVQRLLISEGSTGLVRWIDSGDGSDRGLFDLNQAGASASHAGKLAYDSTRRVFYVLDRANHRVLAYSTSTKKLLWTNPVQESSSAMVLSTDGGRLYIGSPGAVAVWEVKESAARLERSIPVQGPVKALAVGGGRVFVANAVEDSVTSISEGTLAVEKEYPIRVPGLEDLRGIRPSALLYESANGWLLAAEQGINAIGVLDVSSGQWIGHIPSAWEPAGIATHDGTVFAVATRGGGTGPNASRRGSEDATGAGVMHLFTLPDRTEMAAATASVWENNGFVDSKERSILPAGIEHVVLIIKGKRAFDEVLGDVETAGNGPVAGLPVLARYGRYGIISSNRNQLQQRLALRSVNITPNHHEMAKRWTISDNFYASHPIGFAGVSEHLDRHKITNRIFDAGRAMEAPDQAQVAKVMRELKEAKLPRFLGIRLPNDGANPSFPDERYPFLASYIADNDLALGKILEALSNTEWWPKMAVFVVQESAQDGLDHIDSHRTMLFVAGPHAERNYASHVNANGDALMKMVYRLLGVPLRTLQEAAGADLTDCFTDKPDPTPYVALPVRIELFDPEKTGKN